MAPRRRGRPPAARRHRLEKQGLRSVSVLGSSSPASSIAATPQAWVTSPESGGQAVDNTMPDPRGTPDVSLFSSTDLSCLPESVQEETRPDGCHLGVPEYLPNDLFPAEPWQEITGGALGPALDAHHTPSQPEVIPHSPRQLVTQHPLSAYTHWTRVFIMRLYPVFPVVDPGCLLSKLSLTRDAVPRSMARFYAAMSAAVIVQLNIGAGSLPGHQNQNTNFASLSSRPNNQSEPPFSLADRYITDCITERQNASFIEEADEWTILESFFMFSYYGNRVKSKQAWYYLREAMGFAISLGLDREESYDDPELEVNERRRRLYWLLFITERAYCLQHRTTTTLRASIALPQIYDGCDEATLRGFISLIEMFISVGSSFVASWCSRSIKNNKEAFLRLPDPEVFSATSSVVAIDETQLADIAVTQCWLHTLAWQLRDHAICASGRGGSGAAAAPLRKAARSLLSCFSNTRRDAIESHGVGLEQKVFDIAGFMCDLIPTLDQSHLTADTDSIPNLLHNFMCLLANFRNQESCYLGPLAERATALLMLHGGGPLTHEPCPGPIESDPDPTCPLSTGSLDDFSYLED
ncbi:hypothetical protein B0T11DRAFT_80603 [Plectosphaerella cucumerina]|uniref:Xylanolytic transcriptional activator regulatory domain-containing protein n=1 Tax=Plectosphaerella cucumerina TaxID=40658 RepID=A0A8K0TG25_9PEZI|nr:hypothetical protein B0T11DRAFT_80603 [Plectosphaerella cucumerina]